MSNPLIRDNENYVVMEPNKDEQYLTSEETLKWLENWLNKLEAIPKDLLNEASKQEAAKRLLDTACDLEIKPGFTVQWFAIRLTPPG
ncbi:MULTISPECIES: chlororespiratory reduction protein 7 [unclassified Prochlorococcus]|uniref:chlororespiratory reduction protein 7 n=1 Tax=unclassified Prochlorococcus TaxID=2627481 RepID=UPI0005675D4B|nr:MULTISPECIES: chlororespiratory reduction protein 7 [unclassified Prochlorococcus]